jgi:uncharacterized protein HemY
MIKEVINGDATISETPESSRIPLMTAFKAQEIARGLEWLAHSYAEVGMKREASKAERDSQWWMTYSISLSQTRPKS